MKYEPYGGVPAAAAVDALFVAQQGQDLVSPFEVKKTLYIDNRLFPTKKNFAHIFSKNNHLAEESASTAQMVPMPREEWSIPGYLASSERRPDRSAWEKKPMNVSSV